MSPALVTFGRAAGVHPRTKEVRIAMNTSTSGLVQTLLGPIRDDRPFLRWSLGCLVRWFAPRILLVLAALAALLSSAAARAQTRDSFLVRNDAPVSRPLSKSATT
jgi:hypothetical protein